MKEISFPNDFDKKENVQWEEVTQEAGIDGIKKQL